MLMTPSRRPRHRQSGRRARYQVPGEIKTIGLREVIADLGRGNLTARQLEFFRGKDERPEDISLYYIGDLSLLSWPCVSIVGTRQASYEGESRAARLARELVKAGVVVMSGLARGIDVAAQRAAIESGGRTIAVIGTPLSRAYPIEHAELQTLIGQEHLLISPFRESDRVYKSNFPQRNRIMAALSDVTVIVEAAEGSGTLHQAAECQRLKRWLFITRAVAEDPNLVWPKRFIGKACVAVLNSTSDILDKLKVRGNAS
jgi:DNA processing protein